jgi:hypothetical protein
MNPEHGNPFVQALAPALEAWGQELRTERLLEEAAERLIARRALLEAAKPKRWSKLLCDELLENNLTSDKGKNEKGLRIWAFENPAYGDGLITLRTVRSHGGLPPPFESTRDLEGNNIPSGWRCFVEYRTPRCGYCKTEIKEDHQISTKCRTCGANEFEIDQMETIFFFVEPGAKPIHRSLNEVIEDN